MACFGTRRAGVADRMVRRNGRATALDRVAYTRVKGVAFQHTLLS